MDTNKRIIELEDALALSNPWQEWENTPRKFSCLHCGHEYNFDELKDNHEPDCIWMISYLFSSKRETEKSLTK